jgi:outer membrane protein assembly factor BamB
MAPEALHCSGCQGPLPAQTGLVVCDFCGVTNRVEPPPMGTTQVRAVVRRVLAEERQASPTPRPSQRQYTVSTPGVLPALLFSGMVIAAVIAGALLYAERRPPPRSPRSSSPPSPPPPTAPRPVAPPAPRGLGVPDTLALGPDASLYLVSGSTLVKADRKTHWPLWKAPVQVGFGRGSVGSLVTQAGHVAFAGPAGIFFFDAATGAPTGQYLFAHQGFQVSACAVGSTQVLVQTVFDGWLRFDARTAKPTTGTGSCTANREMHCDEGQRCSFAHGRLADMECRYLLMREGHQVTFCEVDGTKEHLVVDHVGGKVVWKSLRAKGAATNPAYASVIEGVLVVGESGVLEGFEATTGEHLWTRKYAGEDSAIVSDGHQLTLGFEGTVIVVDPKTGQETSRYLAERDD